MKNLKKFFRGGDYWGRWRKDGEPSLPRTFGFGYSPPQAGESYNEVRLLEVVAETTRGSLHSIEPAIAGFLFGRDDNHLNEPRKC